MCDFLSNPKKTKRQYIKIVREISVFIVLAMLFLIIFFKYWEVVKRPLDSRGEVWWGVFALYIMKFGVLDYILKAPFLLVWQTGPVTAFLLIPFLYMFGQTVLALRLPIMIISLFTIGLTYLFTNDFFDKRTAVLTVFAFAIMPAYMPISQEHSLMPFFLILSLYIFNKFYKTRNIRYFYLFSFICGLGLISRLSFLFWLTSFILTFKLVFKDLKSRITFKHLAVASLLFVLGTYPYNVPNVWGIAIKSDSIPGASVKTNGISIIEYIIKGIPSYFPKTRAGTNLFDVSTNLKNGLIKWFPEILGGSKDAPIQPFSLFFYLFPFSLLLFIIINVHNWVRYKNVFNKDIFLFLNFLITAVFISTLTITLFRPQEFLMILPMCAMIFGRAFSEILKKFSRFQKSLFYFTIVIMSLLLLFNTNVFFRNFYKYIYENTCVSEAGKVVDSLLELNHSSIYLTDHSSIMVFNWHFYNRGSRDERLYIFFERKEFDNNALYALSAMACSDGAPDRKIENFIEIMNQHNKTVVLEESFYLEPENLVYAIYRIA